ncbi:Os05g0321600 [Oryza sativa Japonica Group]|uniref:Os05g0321600 protein n=1 Tax=Oryza sativa subsp. japonica TaxID=39947 RepID=Q5W6E1_ORYSJ|nr:unknown protein [Oryza sativa Japonica Group]AAV44128.1 unknown protein [Oryza sativa Japonica Group]BAH93076.1 Os05g0321600 [Oryza sativa Japonica Group]|eukprot:NP_001174348.1 Os05g0321600 [Oryza sativa Japonica Group]
MKLIPTGALGLAAAAFDETVAASAGPSVALRGRWQRKADSPPAPARGGRGRRRWDPRRRPAVKVRSGGGGIRAGDRP